MSVLRVSPYSLVESLVQLLSEGPLNPDHSKVRHSTVHVYTVCVKKKPRFRSRSVPFCYGKTGDFFHPVLPVQSFSPFSRARV